VSHCVPSPTVEGRGAALTSCGDDAHPAKSGDVASCADAGVADPVRFFTISDARHYPGLVALVNSLRLQGHGEPITVLDLGLHDAQREALGAECDLVTPPPHSPRHPWLLEPQACMLRDAEIVVYVDADVIVTDPLGSIIDAARDGRICVFTDIPPTRWFAEWEQIFDLAQPPRRQPYVNAGFLAFSSTAFPDLLPRWFECCDRLVAQPTYLDTGSLDSPTALSSQDALNAILMSEVAPDRIAFQRAEAEAQGPDQLARTRVVDLDRLSCRIDDHPTTLLHAWGSPKPWEPAAAQGLRRSAYLRCLRRLLSADDVAVPVPPPSVPMWLRPGARGMLSLWLLTQARRPWRGVQTRARHARARLGRARQPAPTRAPARERDRAMR
jgi:hypothetical protein